MLDLECRRDTLNSLELLSQFNYCIFGIIVCQIITNIILSKCSGFIMTVCVTIIVQYGLIRWTSPDLVMRDAINQNLQ